MAFMSASVSEKSKESVAQERHLNAIVQKNRLHIDGCIFEFVKNYFCHSIPRRHAGSLVPCAFYRVPADFNLWEKEGARPLH